MKQNERFLVYAVTGFLALILVVAVMFTRDPGKGAGGPGEMKGLNDVLGANKVGADKTGATGDPSAGDKAADGSKLLADGRGGVPSPGEVAPQPPLVAGAPKLMVAAELVTQQLGPSRRDRNVRFVRAKNGDSLDQLVRRWCGAREPFLAEAQSLNEDLVVLRVGHEVAVPWVEDEVLLAAIDANKPRTLVAQDAIGTGANGALHGNATPATLANQLSANHVPTKPPTATPSFVLPGGKQDPKASGAGNGKAADGTKGAENGRKPVAAGDSYTVKRGDALWRIAARTYGNKNADRMLHEIKAANPGLDADKLKEGQRIVLPKDPTAGG